MTGFTVPETSSKGGPFLSFQAKQVDTQAAMATVASMRTDIKAEQAIPQPWETGCTHLTWRCKI